jgi:hypothetical protein
MGQSLMTIGLMLLIVGIIGSTNSVSMHPFMTFALGVLSATLIAIGANVWNLEDKLDSIKKSESDKGVVKKDVVKDG